MIVMKMRWERIRLVMVSSLFDWNWLILYNSIWCRNLLLVSYMSVLRVMRFKFSIVFKLVKVVCGCRNRRMMKMVVGVVMVVCLVYIVVMNRSVVMWMVVGCLSECNLK